ncbi:MAG: MATE family efflux transporter [Nocardioides sp.]
MSTSRPSTARATDREILRLAVPALLALVAEPLFLLGDAVVVGRLGTPELAGVGVAAVVLQSVVGLCIFLAYGTTAGVARRLGADDLRGAVALGVDGAWLATLIGAGVTAAGVLTSSWLVGLFDVSAEVERHAVDYLRLSFLGTAPLLVVLAVTGVLRGLQDTRTPLRVAVVGNAANLALNVLLVHGLGWGVAGAAVGTVLAQLGMAGWLLAVLVRAARRHGSPLRPDAAGVARAARTGVPLVVRTLTLRAAIVLTAYAVASATTDPGTATGTAAGADPGGRLAAEEAARIATHQLAMTIWTFLAFVLDAIAIAAQALTGRSLGAGDRDGTRRLTRRMTWWGLWTGVVTGLGLAALSPLLGPLFTADPRVHELLVPVLLVAACFQPVAGVVFVLDGVLIGAGDGRYLAWAGVVVLLAYAPLLLLVGGADLVAVWAIFGAGFIGSRALVLLLRARGGRWMVTGADVGPGQA